MNDSLLVSPLIGPNATVKTKVKCTLKAYNGQYVCAEGGGGREIVANRNAIAGWETFRMNIIETISSVDSSLILVDIESSTLL